MTNLKVTVTGGVKSGKSTIAEIIENALRAHGISVLNEDAATEGRPSHHVVRRAAALHEHGTHVTINTKQLSRARRERREADMEEKLKVVKEKLLAAMEKHVNAGGRLLARLFNVRYRNGEWRVAGDYCACALGAYCLAEQPSPRARQYADEDRSIGPSPILTAARALGITEDEAWGFVTGWDEWPKVFSYSDEDTPERTAFRKLGHELRAEAEKRVWMRDQGALYRQ